MPTPPSPKSPPLDGSVPSSLPAQRPQLHYFDRQKQKQQDDSRPFASAVYPSAAATPARRGLNNVASPNIDSIIDAANANANTNTNTKDHLFVPFRNKNDAVSESIDSSLLQSDSSLLQSYAFPLPTPISRSSPSLIEAIQARSPQLFNQPTTTTSAYSTTPSTYSTTTSNSSTSSVPTSTSSLVYSPKAILPLFVTASIPNNLDSVANVARQPIHSSTTSTASTAPISASTLATPEPSPPLDDCPEFDSINIPFMQSNSTFIPSTLVLLKYRAEHQPTRIACKYPDAAGSAYQNCSFRQLDNVSSGLAVRWKRYFKKQDLSLATSSVAIWCDSTFASLLHQFAFAKLGHRVLLLPPTCTKEEVVSLLKASDASLLAVSRDADDAICSHIESTLRYIHLVELEKVSKRITDNLEAVANDARGLADEPIGSPSQLWNTTSLHLAGIDRTTGNRTSLVSLSNGANLAAGLYLVRLPDVEWNSSDVVLNSFPSWSRFGQTVISSCFVRGSTLALPLGPTQSLAKTISSANASLWCARPDTLEAVLDETNSSAIIDRLAALKTVIYGEGTKLPFVAGEQFIRSGVSLTQVFGDAETGPYLMGPYIGDEFKDPLAPISSPPEPAIERLDLRQVSVDVFPDIMYELILPRTFPTLASDLKINPFTGCYHPRYLFSSHKELEGYFALFGDVQDVIVHSSLDSRITTIAQTNPIPIEEAILSHPLVADCCTIGTGRPMPAIIVRLVDFSAPEANGDVSLSEVVESVHEIIDKVNETIIPGNNRKIPRELVIVLPHSNNAQGLLRDESGQLLRRANETKYASLVQKGFQRWEKVQKRDSKASIVTRPALQRRTFGSSLPQSNGTTGLGIVTEPSLPAESAKLTSNLSRRTFHLESPPRTDVRAETQIQTGARLDSSPETTPEPKTPLLVVTNETADTASAKPRKQPEEVQVFPAFQRQPSHDRSPLPSILKTLDPKTTGTRSESRSTPSHIDSPRSTSVNVQKNTSSLPLSSPLGSPDTTPRSSFMPTSSVPAPSIPAPSLSVSPPDSPAMSPQVNDSKTGQLLPRLPRFDSSSRLSTVSSMLSSSSSSRPTSPLSKVPEAPSSRLVLNFIEQTVASASLDRLCADSETKADKTKSPGIKRRKSLISMKRFRTGKPAEEAEKRAPIAAPPKERCILLTGATGYLGSRVLANLLVIRPHIRIICILKGGDGMKRLERAFEKARLETSLLSDASDRLDVMTGADFSTQDGKFGLDRSNWTVLESSVTDIVHLAWFTKRLSKRRDLWSFDKEDFNGLRTLLSLHASISASRLCRFTFTSDSEAMSTVNENLDFTTALKVKDSRVYEQPYSTDHNACLDLSDGYTQSKFVAELMIHRYVSTMQGREDFVVEPSSIRIVRLCHLAGDSDYGSWKANSPLDFVVRSIGVLGVAPSFEAFGQGGSSPKMDFLPVDTAAKGLVGLVMTRTFKPKRVKASQQQQPKVAVPPATTVPSKIIDFSNMTFSFTRKEAPMTESTTTTMESSPTLEPSDSASSATSLSAPSPPPLSQTSVLTVHHLVNTTPITWHEFVSQLQIQSGLRNLRFVPGKVWLSLLRREGVTAYLDGVYEHGWIRRGRFGPSLEVGEGTHAMAAVDLQVNLNEMVWRYARAWKGAGVLPL